MSELKPCPLCGADPFLGGHSIVWCQKCSAEAHVDDWNRRPDAPSAGEVTADVAIVRAVLHAHQRAMTPPDSGWGDMSYAKGSYDRLPQFQAALKAFRTAIRALPAPPQADGGEG